MSVETITLGCRLNFAESETIARFAPADAAWHVTQDNQILLVLAR